MGADFAVMGAVLVGVMVLAVAAVKLTTRTLLRDPEASERRRRRADPGMRPPLLDRRRRTRR